MNTDFGTPYWWEDGAALPDLPTIPPEKTEVLIVGAGFTGLSAAITAAQNGAEVTVIDAGIPGQGASTRNGGMAGAHPRHSLAEFTRLFGAQTARGIFNEAMPAFEHLQNLIAAENIDCDYQQTGRVQIAWTRAHFRAQQAMAADMNTHTEYKVEVLDRAALADHLVTERYFGGLYYRDHGALQPRKLHDGMMAAARRLGCRVVQNCPVQEITGEEGAFLAHWSGGCINARRIVIATNGYTQGKGVFRYLQSRVFPLPSFIIATEKLGANRLRALAPGGRMMVETRARHSYYRISPDGSRILFGGRAAMVPNAPGRAADKLRRTMCDIWPDLSDVKITHSWSGNTGYSFTHAPNVGAVQGMHFAMGYSGGGVVLAPYLGMKAAYRALGDPRGETAYAGAHLPRRAIHPFAKPYFLRAAELWYRGAVDVAQNLAAR